MPSHLAFVENLILGRLQFGRWGDNALARVWWRWSESIVADLWPMGRLCGIWIRIQVGEEYVVSVIDRHCVKSHNAVASPYVDLCEHGPSFRVQPPYGFPWASTGRLSAHMRNQFLGG